MLLVAYNWFMNWFQGLSEAERLTILTAVAERLVQLERWLLGKLRVPLGETIMAKLTKMTLALVTTAWMALLTTGPTDTFWKEWLALFATATLLHEFGGKVMRAASETKKKRAVEKAG